jgi:homoserine O-acetyltransferase/O-succinyltransferase
MRKTFLFFCLLFLISAFSFAQDGQQQFVQLGNFKLQSGEIIRDCRVGYRTFGKMNADKSNIVLVAIWFGGNSGQIAGSIAPGGFIDSSKYYVVTIDPIGNGVSSSPSNSKLQPHMKFPQFTMADMVNAEHQVLTEFLHIDHVKAITGASMGGMQTFQWIVSYPDFMDKAIPIVGSPRLDSYDLVLWHLQNDVVMNDPAWNHGEYTKNPTTLELGEIGAISLRTPHNFNHEHSREQVPDLIHHYEIDPTMDANDHIRTTQAVMSLDVSAPFGGSMGKAAATVKAKTLIIVSLEDHTVSPDAALDFADLIHAQVIKMGSDCGHQSSVCESAKVNAELAQFLAQERSLRRGKMCSSCVGVQASN